MGFQKGHAYLPPKTAESAARKTAHVSKLHTPEVWKKISDASIGRKLTPDQIENLRVAHLGKKQTPELIEKRRRSRAGYRHSDATRERMSISQKSRFPGEAKSAQSKLMRRGIKFRLWREAVFKRDKWTCQKCGKIGGMLHPHHIRNFSDYPELRFEVENGITLCADHHKEFHTLFGQRHNNPEQITEFIK